jgi:2-methylcitrate dehydratase PrpD
MDKSISQMIADFTLGLSLRDLPDKVIEHSKMLLIDTFGVAIASYNLEHAIIIKNMVNESNLNPQSTLWGTKEKAQLSDAVLYNSALIHGLDYDDTHVAGVVHPSAAVVSTGVSVGEYLGSRGEEVLEAIVAGWEVIIRLAIAAKGRFHDIGYHATGLLSSFASACVAAKLMKLPEEVLINALGICGSQSAALQQFLHDGSWVKKIHPGWAAHSAIYALNMAKRGFKGPREVFEGEYGLWNTHIGTTEGLFEAFSDLNKHWYTPQVTFKMYPVCHFTHSFIDCMLFLEEEYQFTAKDIQKIECRIDGRGSKIVCQPVSAKKRPDTDYMMRFSLPYVMAIAAIKGRVSLWEIDINYARDPEVQALMDKVDCVVDESMHNPGHFPGWVTVTTNNGNVFQRGQWYERGTAQNPIQICDVISKFNDNVSRFISKQQANELIKDIEVFEKLPDMTGLVCNLGKANNCNICKKEH